MALLFTALDAGHLYGLVRQGIKQSCGIGLARNIEFLKGLPVYSLQSGTEAGALIGLQIGLDGPVFFRLKRLHLFFTVTDQAQGDGLDSPGGKAITDFFPEKRRKVKSDQIVENGSGLLGIDQIPGDVSRVSHCVLHGLFGDFVKSHPFNRGGGPLFLDAESLQQVPGDSLSFTVGVSGQN